MIFWDWLNSNSGAVNAILVAILVVITGIYAYQTHRQVRESKAYREMATRPFLSVTIELHEIPGAAAFRAFLIHRSTRVPYLRHTGYVYRASQAFLVSWNLDHDARTHLYLGGYLAPFCLAWILVAKPAR